MGELEDAKKQFQRVLEVDSVCVCVCVCVWVLVLSQP